MQTAITFCVLHYLREWVRFYGAVCTRHKALEGHGSTVESSQQPQKNHTGEIGTRVYRNRTSSSTSMLRTRSILRCKTLVRCYATSPSPHALVFLEHSHGVVDSASLSALTAASQLGGQVTGLVVGNSDQIGQVIEKAKKYANFHYSGQEILLQGKH